IADHPVQDAGEIDNPDLEPALLLDLAPRRLCRRLAELAHPARHAPRAGHRRLAAPHQEHAPLAQDDGADADAREVRVLAAHAIDASQAAVAYLSATRRSTRATSASDSPPGATR